MQARVEALNSCPNYVSYVCRRLDINEEDIKIDRHDSSSSQPRYGSSEEPVVAAFKFLIVPLLMKENIRPKVHFCFMRSHIVYMVEYSLFYAVDIGSVLSKLVCSAGVPFRIECLIDQRRAGPQTRAGVRLPSDH